MFVPSRPLFLCEYLIVFRFCMSIMRVYHFIRASLGTKYDLLSKIIIIPFSSLEETHIYRSYAQGNSLLKNDYFHRMEVAALLPYYYSFAQRADISSPGVMLLYLITSLGTDGRDPSRHVTSIPIVATIL